jgi:hypothetical protein
MHESIVAAVFGHDWCACEMIIAGDAAIAGYEIVGDAVVDVFGLASIMFGMVQRGYAKESPPLVSTPARPGSSRDVVAACGDEDLAMRGDEC